MPFVLSNPAPMVKKRRAPREFSIPDALARADEVFASPCRFHLPRVAGKGRLVMRFVLPLELCPTANALLSMMQGRPKPGKRAFSPAMKSKALEEKVFRMMWIQHPNVRDQPLPGRPMLRIVRFSSVEADEGADGMKLARDLLRMPRAPAWSDRHRKVCGGRKGFGFLVDDAPRFVETARWGEKAKPGAGFGLLEIWTGGT
jgi:hypothetical protein